MNLENSCIFNVYYNPSENTINSFIGRKFSSGILSFHKAIFWLLSFPYIKTSGIWTSCEKFLTWKYSLAAETSQFDKFNIVVWKSIFTWFQLYPSRVLFHYIFAARTFLSYKQLLCHNFEEKWSFPLQKCDLMPHWMSLTPEFVGFYELKSSKHFLNFPGNVFQKVIKFLVKFKQSFRFTMKRMWQENFLYSLSSVW